MSDPKSSSSNTTEKLCESRGRGTNGPFSRSNSFSDMMSWGLECPDTIPPVNTTSSQICCSLTHRQEQQSSKPQSSMVTLTNLPETCESSTPPPVGRHTIPTTSGASAESIQQPTHTDFCGPLYPPTDPGPIGHKEWLSSTW